MYWLRVPEPTFCRNLLLVSPEALKLTLRFIADIRFGGSHGMPFVVPLWKSGSEWGWKLVMPCPWTPKLNWFNEWLKSAWAAWLSWPLMDANLKVDDKFWDTAWEVAFVNEAIGAQTVEWRLLKDPFSRPLGAIIPRDTDPENPIKHK